MGVTFNSSFFSKVKGLETDKNILDEACAASEEEALAEATAAGEQLAQCVTNAISSSGLNGGAIAAVGDIESTAATRLSSGCFQVGVTIGSEFRPSLQPIYVGVSDMAALLNNGYSARGIVYGEWHGRLINSLQAREGAHFVEAGASDFLGSFSGKGKIISLEISDRFN